MAGLQGWKSKKSWHAFHSERWQHGWTQTFVNVLACCMFLKVEKPNLTDVNNFSVFQT